MDERGANFGRLLAIRRAADPNIARTIVAILAACDRVYWVEGGRVTAC